MVVSESATDRESVLEAVRELAPELTERAGEAEALRTLPDDLVAKMKRAGLFRLALPRALGGRELDPTTIVEVVETVSRADGSAGWTLLIGNATAFFAWLDPAVAKGMIGDDPDFCSTSMFGPMGRAVPDGDDAFVVSGRWPFNSGCPHSEWLQVGVFVLDGDMPRFRDDGAGPDWRFAYVPAEAVVIEDTWDALGLRGTGSHHLTITDRRVPAEHLAAPVLDMARHEGPLWRMPLFTLVGVIMSGFPLGVGRRAIDEFVTLAKTKFRGNPLDTVAGDGFAQVELGRAEAALEAARAYVYDVVADLWEECRHTTEALNLETRTRMLLAASHAMRSAVDAVDSLYRLAGAGAVYAGDPLQRCFRDLHTANQHIIFSSNRDKAFAKLQFGIEQPLSMI
jgi:alkylation response protein AidB-like acyl-CoA dehydrogenase